MNLTSLQKGIGLMVLTWTLFAIMSALAKYSYRYVPTNITFFFQNFAALCFLSLFFFRKGKGYSVPSAWGWVLARGCIGAFSFYCLFWTLTKIPLTDGIVLNNTAPLFVPLILQLCVKKKSNRRVWFSILIGFFGVLLILKPTGEIFQLAALGGLVSGICSAAVMVIMRRLASEDPRIIILVYLGIASLCIFPFAVSSLASIPAPAWPILIAIGILFASAQFAYTRSFRYAEPATLAPFSYAFVAASGLIDWLVWNHAPNFLSAVGILLVIGGGVFTILASRMAATDQVLQK